MGLDCPRCGNHRPYVNIGKGHWGYCVTCRVTWMFGANMFSHWRDETETEQRARYDGLGLGDFEGIEDTWHPDTRRAYEASEYAVPDFAGGVASIEDPYPPVPIEGPAEGPESAPNPWTEPCPF